MSRDRDLSNSLNSFGAKQMNLPDAMWVGRSKFFLPTASVRHVVAAYMDVAVTMSAMPYFTIERINIPLKLPGSLKIGDHISDASGFVSLAPTGMQPVTTDGEIRYRCIDLFGGMASRLLNIDISSASSPFLPVSNVPWLEDLGE